jgi:F-type H+-transporting ATPase subunit delta
MKTTRNTRRAARYLFQLCLINGRLDRERALQIARRLAASRRRGALATLAGFQRLVRLDQDRHSAVVESAVRLPDDLRGRVEADLVRTYGGGLTTSFEQNAALIGGMRIKVGSDVYDGSVRNKLAALAARW